MSAPNIRPTGRERFFENDEIIVSKTDLKGRITYANRVFMRVAQYEEAELIGAPHSIVRHPHMPRCVFKLLWDTISAGNEIFAYVLNMASSGDHYWVFAHVTPSYAPDGTMVGYHSSRRVPDRDKLDKIWPIYQALYAEEQKYENRKQGMEAAFATMVGLLAQNKVGYDQFVFSL